MTRYFSRLQDGTVILICKQAMYFLSFVFFPLFLKNQGFSEAWIISLYVSTSAISLFLIPLINIVKVRLYLLISFSLILALSISLVFLNSYSAFLAYLTVESLLFVFFWVPLNKVYFQSSKNNTNATDSTIYFIITGTLSILLPFLGSLLIVKTSFKGLFLITALLSLVPLIYIFKKIPEQRITQKFSECIINFKGLELITCIEGSHTFLRNTVIPIYALLFLNTEFEVGGFLSYLALVGLIVSIFISAKSDKSQRRLEYLSPLLILLSISIFSLAYNESTIVWLILAGAYTMMDSMSAPLRLTIIMDRKELDLGFWRAREFFLNLGRVVIVGLCALFFYYEVHYLSFILFGIITIVYLFVAKNMAKLQ